jgi:hypothetical protein
VSVVCCQVEVSASGWSLVHRRPTECGVSECDREASIMRMPWPTTGTGSFPGVKRPGRGVDHPTPSSAEVLGRVELYLYSPSGPSWPVLGRTLPLPGPLAAVVPWKKKKKLQKRWLIY